MIDSYLNETAVLEKYTAQIDDYGRPIYESPVTIPCRSQQKMVTVRTPIGDQLKLTTEYYTKSMVRTGDKLDGRVVEGVTAWKDLGGKFVGAKSWV